MKDKSVRSQTVQTAVARNGWNPWRPLVGRHAHPHPVQGACQVNAAQAHASPPTEAVIEEGPRVLILTSELGCGHARAAHAIEHALVAQRAGAQIRVLDWWTLMDERVARVAQAMYLQLIQQHPDLYERLYRLGDGTWRCMLAGNAVPVEVRELFASVHKLFLADTENAAKNHPLDCLMFGLFRSPLLARMHLSKLLLIKWGWSRLERRLRTALMDFRPDIVISTQMIPAALVSAIKCARPYASSMPISVAVPTDFGVHDFWCQPGTDLYCVPHEEVTELPAKLNARHVLPTGFPLMPDFARPPCKTEARRVLRLAPDVPVILVLGGGLGLGIETVAQRVLQATANMQLVVLRGRNVNTGPNWTALVRDPRVIVHDWTDRVDLFIAASDVVVSKFGGSTVAEVLACGRPLLATRSLPGQEGFNVRFLEKHGVARVLEDYELPAELEHLLAHPAELQQVAARAAALGRRDGASTIAKCVVQAALARPVTHVDASTMRAKQFGRRVLARIDTWYGRWFRLRPLGPVLLVGCEPYRGQPREFPDGTKLRLSETVGVLHFNNVRLAALRRESRQGLGVRFARLFRDSLHTLACHAQADPELKSVTVYHGVTWFKAHGRKVGFVSETLPPGLRRWWLSGHFRLLTWGFASLPIPATERLEPRSFWITRGDLIKHFGGKRP